MLTEAEELELMEMELELEGQQAPMVDPFGGIFSGASSIQPDVVAPTPQSNALESFLRGASQGATKGFGEELSARFEQGISKVAELLGLQDQSVTDLYKSKTYEDLRNTYRDQNRKAQEANPVAYGVGEVAGVLPSAIAVAPASLPGMIAAGGIESGLYGAGLSEADSASGVLQDAATSGAIGAGATGALGGLMKGARAAIGAGTRKLQGLAPSLKESAEEFAVDAVGRKNKTLRDLLGRGNLEDVGRAALDEKIVTPGASTDDIVKRALARSKEAGKELGDFEKTVDKFLRNKDLTGLDKATLDSLDYTRDQFARDLKRRVVAPLKGQEGSRADAQFVEKWIEREILGGGGKKLGFGRMRGIRTNIDDLIKEFGGDQPKLGRQAALRRLRTVIEDMNEKRVQRIDQITGADLSKTYGSLKNRYSRLAPLRELAEDTQLRDQRNNLLGLNDYILGAGGAVAGAAFGEDPMDKLKFAALGLGTGVGANVLRSRLPQMYAGTADRFADFISKQAAPQIGRVPAPFASGLRGAASTVFGNLGATDAPAETPQQQVSRPTFAEFLQESPKSAGKFAPQLKQAATEGPQKLAVEHYKLSTQEPDYQRSFYGKDNQ